MGLKAKLSEIVDAMECQSEEMTPYLNHETGEVRTMPSEVIIAAENNEDTQEIMDTFGCDEQDIKTAQEINQGEQWIPLPSQYDIHEYKIMERFCNSQKDPHIRELLTVAISGKGAFRRFKDTADRIGVINQWYEFRKKEFEEIAKEWCRENEVECG
jgi:hypothetical protein